MTSENASIEIEHEYEISKVEKVYPLRVLLKDDKTGMSLATAEAQITVPLEGPKVFITARHLIGPPGATFDMEALASPKGTYKFVWEVEGLAEAYNQKGKKSEIAPIIYKNGEYTATVKLYDLDGNYLTKDAVTITVEPDLSDIGQIDGIVDIEEDNNPPIRAWVLVETTLEDRKKQAEKLNKRASIDGWGKKYKIEHLKNSSYFKTSDGGEVFEVQFGWTDPPKIIKHNDAVSLTINGTTIKNTASRNDFACFYLGIDAQAYAHLKNEANADYLWSSGIRDKDGILMSGLGCDKQYPTWAEEFYMKKFPQGKENDTLTIVIAIKPCDMNNSYTKYIYEWK